MMSHTRNLKLVILLLLTIIALALSAIYLHTPETEGAGPDLNGYTAQYECRAGNPNCNVDVTANLARACDQTITTANSWSSINWSNNTICLTEGDYRSKGYLEPSTSGTSETRKVLKCVKPGGGAYDKPWAASNPCQIQRFFTNGHDYWIVGGIRADWQSMTSVSGWRVEANSNDWIFHEIEAMSSNISGTGAGLVVADSTNNNITLQNSVIHTIIGAEEQCVYANHGANTRIVNNEFYDCNKGVTQSDGATAVGIVVENNDIYQSDAARTDCNGNFTPTGNCGVMEAGLGFKWGSTQANPARLIHNRIFDMRYADGNLLDNPGGAVGVSISRYTGSSGADWMLVQNNILTNITPRNAAYGGSSGIWNYHGYGSSPTPTPEEDGPNNVSVIGNLLYNMGVCLEGWRMQQVEYYLNTNILCRDPDRPNDDGWLVFRSGAGEQMDNNDIRCNVAIDSSTAQLSGTGNQFNNNAYYNTPDSGEPNKVSKGITTISGTLCTTANCLSTANTTGKATGDIVRTTSTTPSSCSSTTDQNCFLYKVTQVGNTGQVQAIRGPYTFYRKLKTSPELFTIPYATPYSSAPESGFCPTSTGTRGGVGVSDAGIF